MRRVVGMVVLLLSPGVLPAAPAADAPPSMTGLWRIAGDVTGRPVIMMCQLTESNRKLSGTCSGEDDGYAAHKITGTVKAQKVQFYFQTSIGGGGLTLIVSGTINEDRSKMEGDLDVEPMAIGGLFQGMRELDNGARTEAAPAAVEAPVPTEAAAPSPAATPVDATGTWKIDGDVQGSPVRLTCVLTEAERKLTGTCTGENRAARSVTGAATEKGVGWRYDDDYQGQPISVQMDATLAGDGSRMNGTMAVAPFGAQGTFVAIKQPPSPN